jgi:hypothetical protein
VELLLDIPELPAAAEQGAARPPSPPPVDDGFQVVTQATLEQILATLRGFDARFELLEHLGQNPAPVPVADDLDAQVRERMAELQLGKDDSEDLYSLSSVLRRSLKKYIVDGASVAGTRVGCDKCGSSNLKYQEGCPLCIDCGYTKCS